MVQYKCTTRLGHFKIIVVFLSVVSILVSCATREPDSIEGTWVITEALAPGISAMSDDEKQARLGLSYQYSKNQVVLDQTHCQDGTWQKNSLSKKAFFSNYHISFEDLGIVANRIDEYTVSCNAKSTMPGEKVIVNGRDEAFTLWDGVFFRMEKAKEPE